MLDLTIYKLDCKSHKVTCISNKSNNLKLKCIILPLFVQFLQQNIHFVYFNYPHFQYRKEEVQKSFYFLAIFRRRAFRCSVTCVLYGAETHTWIISSPKWAVYFHKLSPHHRTSDEITPIPWLSQSAWLFNRGCRSQKMSWGSYRLDNFIALM